MQRGGDIVCASRFWLRMTTTKPKGLTRLCAKLCSVLPRQQSDLTDDLRTQAAANPFCSPPLLHILSLCRANAVSGGLGGLYHQPAATVHGEGEVVGREGMQLRLVEQAGTDPTTLSYPNGSITLALFLQTCRRQNHLFMRRSQSDFAQQHPSDSEKFWLVAVGQDVLLSCLNLLRFVLLRDRPTPDHPAGMTGVWSEEWRRQLAVRQTDIS